MSTYDVIIPVGEKDVRFVPRVVDHITRCLSESQHIYILTSNRFQKKIERKLQTFQKCIVIDENKLIENLSYSRIDKILKTKHPKSSNSTGWYYQQFLKFAFSLSEYSSDYYVSWDADTLALAPIKFFEGDSILYCPKNEYNSNYFKTIEKLFGFGKVSSKSFISENMLFSSAILREMINEIESSELEGIDWVEKILNACDFSNALPGFSEFETYGSYCFVHYPGLYKERYLASFREAGFIAGRKISEKRLRAMSFDLDVASFEMSHAPLFPYNIPNIFWHVRLRINKIMEMNFTELIRHIKNKRKRINSGKEIEEKLYRLPNKKNTKK